MSADTPQIEYDGLGEREFRDAMEQMLRQGDADAAAMRLRALLAPLCGPGAPLPARFLTVEPAEVMLKGWEQLPKKIASLARPGKPITALSIDFSSPGHSDQVPDDRGHLDPYIETNFFNDSSWPFSTADRAGLLAGYSSYASEWQGCFEDIDNTISVQGIGDLYGATIALEERSRTPMISGMASVDERRAHLLGSCLLAVLLHRAVRDRLRSSPLPHAMAVFVGSNESYPFFDAPVTTAGETGLAPAVDQPIADAPLAARAATKKGLFSRLLGR